MKPSAPPVALTIAGSDSGGGAGIQADLKVFAALGVFGTTAVTAITAQNPSRMIRIEPVPAAMVAAQMRAAFEAFDVRAAKCGMLATAGIVQAVASALRAKRQTPNSKLPRNAKLQAPKLVVDPILRATSGAMLLEPRARKILESELIPLAMVVTPNLLEARVFLRRDLPQRDAAQALAQRWGTTVLLKGGHSAARRATDVLCDGRDVFELNEARVRGAKIHGLGCALSAAITAFLAQGHLLLESVLLAKKFITEAVHNAEVVGGHQALHF